jgi:hypothetical protein
MKDPTYFRKRQKSPLFVALLLFNLVLVILQLWLFVSALEGILAGETVMVIPAAFVSMFCLGINVWMLAGINRIERES